MEKSLVLNAAFVLLTYLCSCFGETVVHKLRQALSVLTDWSRVVFKKQYNMFTKMK